MCDHEVSKCYYWTRVLNCTRHHGTNPSYFGRTLPLQHQHPDKMEAEGAQKAEIAESVYSEDSALGSLDTEARCESLYTQAPPQPQPQPQTAARRLEQRLKQIGYGKNTQGYRNYTRTVATGTRLATQPRTPDRHAQCSKRAWDGQLRVWRRMLHAFDDCCISTTNVHLDPANHST